MHYQFNSAYKMTNKHQKQVQKKTHTHKLRSQIMGARFQVVFFEEKISEGGTYEVCQEGCGY